MTKKEYLQSLFKSHLADLKSVDPGADDIFVCPICLREFNIKSIDNGEITDGHVWPTDLRKKSSIANNQTILLCRDCNNSAGSKGDAQMQIYERIKDSFKECVFYGIRTVEIVEDPGENPIRLRAHVSINSNDEVIVTGNLDSKNRWIGSSINDQIRFEESIRNSIETQQIYRVKINPPKEYKSNLVYAGWITSAYLMAFYTLGYRYILNREFDFLREFITSSFKHNSQETLAFPIRDDFYLSQIEANEFPDPLIRLKIPINRDEHVSINICFLSYEISLPILLDQKVFSVYWSMVKRQLQNQELPPIKEGEYPCIYDYLHCTKTIEHICIYDFLLGKPLPIAKI